MIENVLNIICRKKTATLPDLKEALAGLSVEDAEREAARLEAERKRLLIEGSEKDVLDVEERLRVARINVERTRAAIEELTRRIAEAEQQAADAARRKRYATSKKQANEAAQALRTAYPEIAARALGLLRQLAEAELAVDEANRDLPVGAEPLESPELLIRGTAGEPRQVIRETEVSLWCAIGSAGPAPEEIQSQIIADTDGRGYRSSASGPQRYVKRRFMRVEFHPSVSSQQPDRLWNELQLPTLTGDGLPIWRAGVSIGSPQGVLQRLTAIENATLVAPSRTEPRPIEVEFHPIDVVPAARAA